MSEKELTVFVNLDAEEGRTDQHGGEKVEEELEFLPLLDRRERQHHGHRRTDQNEGVGCGEVDAEWVDVVVIGLRPVHRRQGNEFRLAAGGVDLVSGFRRPASGHPGKEGVSR